MEIVNIEENCAAAIERNDALRGWASGIDAATTGGGELRLFITTAGGDLFKRLNWSHLSVNLKFEVIPG
jgi:hypothetical protein